MEQPNITWPVPLSLTERHEHKLAYRYKQGKNLTIVYLGGFHSNMNGEKANQVFKHAVDKYGFSALCLDYSGHGSSEGIFHEGNISTWLADALHIIKTVTDGPLIICGSSMGAWISTLAALQLKERVKALLTIAAATDMTQKFIWEKCDAIHQNKLLTEGFFDHNSQYDEEPYKITMQLIEDGKKHLILDKPIKLNCPVRMLHGTADLDIDWQNSLNTMNQLTSKDVHLNLIKDAGHRLSDPEHIEQIIQAFEELINTI
ncbi:MAG: alpha/beta hydrolase [Lentisphaeraceae bacterium]|nr:alpha/beta hydrolase [Lentisphaeraceae bacterium]